MKAVGAEDGGGGGRKDHKDVTNTRMCTFPSARLDRRKYSFKNTRGQQS